MKQGFVTINNVPTNVLTFGGWIENDLKPDYNQEIILVIPGNPGITGFYEPFLRALHNRFGCPVWVLSHAGHEFPINPKLLPNLESNGNLYDLNGQIQHKVEFIKKFVPQNAKLHLIGHSIGSHILIELLKIEAIKQKNSHVHLLFPTIQNMSQSKNGKLCINFLQPMLRVIIFLSLIFTYIPSIIQQFLIYCYIKLFGASPTHLNTLTTFIHPVIIENVVFMAMDEMDKVKNPNCDIIQENLDKIQFVCSNNDKWVPDCFLPYLKSEFPNINLRIVNINHAFVLKDSEEVADLVADNIKSN